MRRGGRTVLKSRVLRTTGGLSAPAPVLINPGTHANEVGEALVPFSLTAEHTVTNWKASNLPAGIKINAKTGILSGTFTTVATQHPTVTAEGPGGSSTVTFEWVVNAAGPIPTVTKPPKQITPVGEKVSLQIEATNATVYEAFGLPAGTSMNTATGLIIGTILNQEDNIIHVTVKGPGGTATMEFEWEGIAQPPPPYGPALANSVANEIYGLIEPLTYADKGLGYPILKYLDGIGLMWSDLDPIVRDKANPNGTIVPGYATVMDLQSCPESWLPWLGQFTGVFAPEMQPGLDRELIMAASGLKRGTPASIKAFIAQFLIGQKRVDLFERSEGKAYKLTIVTYASETPEETPILRAIQGEDLIPAGIIVDYKVVSGWIYEGIELSAKTYQQLKEAYPTYERLARKE